MQTFKAEKRSPKAVLEIGENKYEFYSPNSGQVIEFQKKLSENRGNVAVESEIMLEYLVSLSNAPVEVVKGLDSELFDELLTYVITPQKKR